MTSLWLAGRDPGTPSSHNLDDPTADIVVVGAGITGLITAVLLARAGKKVLVLEARTVGAGASGNTTAKISLLQGTKLSKVAAKHGNTLVRQYVEGNREGQAWVVRHCERHGLAVQHEDAYTYAQSADGVASARDEYQAARDAGLGVQWEDDAPVPFPFHGGVRLAEQAQFDPVPFLQSLVIELEAHGGRLVEGARVRSVALPGRKLRMQVHTGERGDITVSAQQLVLATGIPILDRGGFFARVKPERSYCQAYTVPGDITRGMYISTDSPTRSVRYAPTTQGEVLIVGGARHPVGREKSPSAALAELARWTVLHYPGATQTHFWSAQDYSPADGLPYVGPILPGGDTIFVATGFDKWGMTNGPAAAIALAGRILGGNIEWAKAFTSWSAHELTGITTAVQANLEVGFNLAKGWITPIIASSHAEPEQGGGLVSGPPWHLAARSAVDGERQTVSPVCPHLGGIVNWNDADQAWECPLHGSRFAPDGTLLEGPATRDLTRS